MDLVDCLNKLAYVILSKTKVIKGFIYLDSSDPECCSNSDDVVGMSSLADSSLFGTDSLLSASKV